jgi:DNA-binding MarR family transcriptional regulator
MNTTTENQQITPAEKTRLECLNNVLAGFANQKASGTSLRVLLRLAQDYPAPVRMCDLAYAAEVTPAAMTGSTQKLCQLGFARLQHSLEDRRVLNVHLEPRGMEVLKGALRSLEKI